MARLEIRWQHVRLPRRGLGHEVLLALNQMPELPGDVVRRRAGAGQQVLVGEVGEVRVPDEIRLLQAGPDRLLCVHRFSFSFGTTGRAPSSPRMAGMKNP